MFTVYTCMGVTLSLVTIAVLPSIESLILAYDMRCLNDITWFLKCWYHTGLMEALFIGMNREESLPPQPFPVDPMQTYWSPSTSGDSSAG